jgi:hypothetical protein
MLLARKEYEKFLMPQGDPFYSLYPVREYTFAPHKVVFREISTRVEAAVISEADCPDGTPRMVVPDHKLVLIGCEAADEAHYLCALLNSDILNAFAMAYTVGTQISTHLVANVRIPRFDPRSPVHRKLARISADCHALAQEGRVAELQDLEEELNSTAEELWGVGRD